VFRHLNFRVAGEAPAGRDAGDELRPQYGVILLIAFGIFSLVLLVGGRLAQALTADLERLETFARDVMSKGLTGERAQVSGAPEIRSLAASINEMLDRLSGQHATLAAEGEKLATLARALTLADRRKDEFLAMLAHELRNPLAPISSGATLLRLQASDSKQVTRTSEIISRQVQHMTKIVDDLLDVSRVTRGLVTLRNDPVDLASVVHAAVDQVQPFIHQRQHSLELRLPPHAPTVMGDHARLVQVVSNLLQNAAKYTPPRGRIVLAVTAQGESVQLTVQDNGGGIAPEFMPEIFDLFTQGARSPDRSQGGLGLGLPLVKNLVELHGGTVDAASPGLGQGSTFTVRLALAPPATPSPGRPPPPPPQGMPGGALRLMVVDDNVDAASTLAAVLEMEGHSVSVFADALSALQHAAEGFDAFILDIGLPGMDGTQLARRLRHMPPCAGAVLIALTGYGQETDRQRTAEAGFDHHLVKPVDPQQLLGLLASR
jgi:signal transduction histidine kinase